MTITVPERIDADEPPSNQMDRASLVLGSFAGHAQQSLAEVTRRTGLPRSTTHRMLERLVQMQWLRRGGRDYELGARLIELGALAANQSRLHAAAVPVMRELHRVTGHAVYLGVLDGADVLYTQRVGVHASSVRVGGRRPAWESPIGLCLLAGAPDIVDECAPADRAMLQRTREDGVSYVNAGRNRGIGAVITEAGEAVAAISVCAPADRLYLDHRSAAPVRMAAATIIRDMVDHGVASRPVLARRHPLRTMPTARLHALRRGA